MHRFFFYSLLKVTSQSTDELLHGFVCFGPGQALSVYTLELNGEGSDFLFSVPLRSFRICALNNSASRVNGIADVPEVKRVFLENKSTHGISKGVERTGVERHQDKPLNIFMIFVAYFAKMACININII